MISDKKKIMRFVINHRKEKLHRSIVLVHKLADLQKSLHEVYGKIQKSNDRDFIFKCLADSDTLHAKIVSTMKKLTA